MSLLKTMLALACVGYVAVMGLMFAMQRRLLFAPDTQRIAPASVGLAQAQAREIVASDGERLVAWHIPPAEGAPLLLYLHGNGGQIAGRADRFAQLTAEGFGLFALSYRGYGGSTGAPSEAGLMQDARAAYAAALATGAQRIVLIGESLGSAVAVRLAAEKPVAALALEAPFPSVAAVAADIYWWLPVRRLIRDPFRSDEHVERIGAPVLMVHGVQDPVMPIRYGEALFAMAKAPKDFWRIDGAGHQPLDSPDVMARLKKWIAEKAK